MLLKHKVVVAVIAIILIVAAIFVIRSCYDDPNLHYSQEYIAGSGNIQGDVDVEYFVNKSADFDIGANHYGYAVFKKPGVAFARLKQDFKAGIKLIQMENMLLPLSRLYYKPYGTYGWQVCSGTFEEREQAAFVTRFMDIYENSFQKH